MADEELTDDRAFCASCFSPVDEDVDNCHSCGVALSGPAIVRSRKSVAVEGETVRRRTRTPSALIVIGMWLILLPGLVMAFGYLMHDSRARLRITVGLVFWAYGSVLYRVTSRYFEAKRSRNAGSALQGSP